MISRRHFLQASAVLGGAMLLPACNRQSGRVGSTAGSTDEMIAAGEGLRIAHVTDLHLMDKRNAVEGLERCLQTVAGLTPRPAFMLNGGDVVHDARQGGLARTHRLYRRAVSMFEACGLPIYHCIGNHDCVGWGPDSPVKSDDPAYGKALFRDYMNVEALNTAFDAGGWRIVIVDNILPTRFDGKGGYQGGFDEDTLAFMDRRFTEAGDRPKLLCTHIPIVSAVARTYTDDTFDRDRPMATRLVTGNSREALALLDKHRVGLVLTGHLHQRERIAYQHTTHIGQGAVSGRWWFGPNAGTAEGFGVLDLAPDGRWRHTYQTYGWEADAG